MKRYTIDDIKKRVEELYPGEYTILEYTNTHGPMKLKHNLCGSEFTTKQARYFLEGDCRCHKCFFDKRGTHYSNDDFLKSLEKKYPGRKFNILTNYKTRDERITISVDGEKFTSTPHIFLDNYAFSKKNKPYTTKTFKKAVKELVGNEYTVLGEYKNTKEKILIRHNKCNFEYEVAPNRFLSGRRCPKCSGHLPITKEIIQDRLDKKYPNEYEAISIEDNKVLVKHLVCGNTFLRDKGKFGTKLARCPNCYMDILKTTDEFKEDVANVVGDEYEVLGEYTGTNNLLLMKHKKCNKEFYMRPSSFLNGNRCPNCCNKTSKLEEELRKFIISLGFKPKKKNFLVGDRRYEVDIYIDELKIGFEFDGLYWHSDVINKDKLNIYHKTEAINSLGIELYHVFEDEWVFKKEIVKNKIRSILNVSNIDTVYARKCKVIDIDSTTKNSFLETNHIQGKDICTYAKALEYNSEIVAVMTFSKPRKSLGNKMISNSSIIRYELSRYATSKRVVGGASKLLNAFLKEHPETNEILTYADLRWSSMKNNLYNALNFKLDHISRPDYFYFKNNIRYHRYNFRKQVLQKKFPDIYDDNLTEFEIMDKAKYKRIYDCGNLVYIKTV